MKFIIFLFIFFAIITISSCKKRTSCQYRIHENSSVLLSVEKLNKCSYDRYLKISNKQITKIASNTFKNITIQELVLDLSNDNLELIDESFIGLPFIKNLELRGNLKSLDKNIFKYIHHLRGLKININEKNKSLVESLPGGFKNLTILSLKNSVLFKIGEEKNCDYCQTLLILEIIHIVTNDAFRGLVTRDLYLSDNKIIKIEDNAFKNSKIKILTLINVYITVEKNAWGLGKATNVQTKRPRSRSNYKKTTTKNYKKMTMSRIL
ncbi:hypothetical protein HCN44_009418 [Aphidius gifuensis]|uniref:Odorant-binding protein n=1 Tax=Aphidius gifuensis TaxID=684658 RepID=A0A834Y4M0_APHGI|nr:hypothetical protein HCN44_009418 [Aphidius gifuensis]